MLASWIRPMTRVYLPPPFGLVHLRCAFTLAYRARCAAAIFLRADADLVRLGFGARPFAFAHRAFCAKLIRRRADADIVRLGFV
jgi:hypothetical protein